MSSLTLHWVPRPSKITGNEKTDECPGHGSSTSYIGPAPPVKVPNSLVRKQIRKWINKKTQRILVEYTQERTRENLSNGPSGKRNEELLQQNRNRLRTITGLLTVQRRP